MKLGYPNVTNERKRIIFSEGRYCNLPKEYNKTSNKKLLEDFYTRILSESNSSSLNFGEDPLGFTYLNMDFVCYIGLVTSNGSSGKYRNLRKKYPENRFPLEYLKKQIQFEYDLLNFKEFIPIDLVTQNLHEIRGLNSKIAGNIDSIMSIDSENEWEEKFESQPENVKKIFSL